MKICIILYGYIIINKFRFIKRKYQGKKYIRYHNRWRYVHRYFDKKKFKTLQNVYITKYKGNW